jgi:peptidyl-prolyl cis-trans isomerase D
MLTTIREKAQGWIAWVIVIIISVPFALWGINEYFSAQEKVVIAEINGDELYSQEFQEVVRKQRSALRQQFGGKIDNKIFETKAFKLRVLNEMITQRLVSADIQNHTYQIGDEQLAIYLRSNPAFQIDGAFSPELYAQAVRRNGLSLPEFENRIRLGNIVAQIEQGFTRSVIENDAVVEDLLRLQVEISNEDIRNYYDSHKESFMTPEEVRVEYISLSLQDVASQIKPDEKALLAFYEENKDQYIQAEQRQAQHILLAVAADADEVEVARVSELASDLAQQARDGKDFSELAKTYSVDSISSENGGDLGYFEKGVMDKAFDEKVFNMQKGEISEPVKTRFGYHIIKLNDIKPETGKSFDQVKEKITNEYALTEATLRYGQMAEELQNLVFEQPTTLQPAADALGLKIVSTDWFSRAGGDGIAQKGPFINSAFTEDVLLEGLNSEVLEIADDTLVALRLLDHREPQQKPLNNVSDDIKQILLSQRSNKLASKEADEMIKALRSGSKTLAQIAEQHGVQMTVHEGIGRSDGADLSPEILSAVFRSAVNSQDSDKEAGSAQLENGDFAIFSISKVKSGNAEDISDDVREQIRSIIQQRNGEALFSDYERGLYELADIVIYEDKL